MLSPQIRCKHSKSHHLLLKWKAIYNLGPICTYVNQQSLDFIFIADRNWLVPNYQVLQSSSLVHPLTTHIANEVICSPFLRNVIQFPQKPSTVEFSHYLSDIQTYVFYYHLPPSLIYLMVLTIYLFYNSTSFY